MQGKITKSSVDRLSPEGRDVCLWDTEVKGYGVRCRPGGAKYYVLKFRRGKRQRWVRIGRHGSPWTPDTARKEALRLLGLTAGGTDPAANRDRQKGVISVAQLAARFLNDHARHRCKRRTVEDYQRILDQHIVPVLGHHSVTELGRPDVASLHLGMRKHPYQANRTLSVLSKMLTLAEEWGVRPDGSNPCRHVKKYRETKRERYLTTEELQRLGNALSEAQTTESPFALAAIRLLTLTGARLSEILTLRWDYVDLANGVLRLPDSKTGPKLIRLNTPAIDVLNNTPRMQNNPFVIAGHRPGARLINLQKPWRRIRAAAGLDDVRIHDLRHSYASVGAGAGLSLLLIGKLLGHSQPATTARYAHLADDPQRQASEAIGDAIITAMATGARLLKRRDAGQS